MSIKLFILGRPGSGKSTAYRRISEYIDRHYLGWSVTRCQDYAILQDMFWREKQNLTYNKDKQFCETNYGGFDVRNFDVLTIALKKLEKQVRERCSPSKDELIVIEFARDNYIHAFQQFSASFLKDAYFLFVEADLETCIQRVKDRVTDPPTLDNHFVSKDIMKKYYGQGSMPPSFKTDCHIVIDRKKIKTINSRGSLEAFNTKVEQYIEPLLARENSFPPPQAKIPRPKVLTRLLAHTYR